ncbi:hypothetical protein GFH48_09710 [Streptomyces fagopyri]|uniref:Uncharacterized protein n=1 Tax=Streptomyces fagopyri TaxID=2662397 RepID=A0A5Q0L8W8_9ACTN|nr:hypothetical protein GFH48_09710 [Streptomyces fagopyri]
MTPRSGAPYIHSHRPDGRPALGITTKPLVAVLSGAGISTDEGIPSTYPAYRRRRQRRWTSPAYGTSGRSDVPSLRKDVTRFR